MEEKRPQRRRRRLRNNHPLVHPCVTAIEYDVHASSGKLCSNRNLCQWLSRVFPGNLPAGDARLQLLESAFPPHPKTQCEKFHRGDLVREALHPFTDISPPRYRYIFLNSGDPVRVREYACAKRTSPASRHPGPLAGPIKRSLHIMYICM